MHLLQNLKFDLLVCITAIFSLIFTAPVSIEANATIKQDAPKLQSSKTQHYLAGRKSPTQSNTGQALKLVSSVKYAPASAAKICNRVNWRGSGLQSQSIPATVTVKANTSCWVRFIGNTGPRATFKGGEVKSFGNHVRVKKTGNNKITISPKIGYIGTSRAVVHVNLSRSGKPIRLILNYKITVK